MIRAAPEDWIMITMKQMTNVDNSQFPEPSLLCIQDWDKSSVYLILVGGLLWGSHIWEYLWAGVCTDPPGWAEVFSIMGRLLLHNP